jgi:hypothetical protein
LVIALAVEPAAARRAVSVWVVVFIGVLMRLTQARV